MKKLLITAIVAVSSLAGLQTTHAQTLTNGLVAFYPFEGNANDASGNGRNLTPHNDTYSSGLRGLDLATGRLDLTTNNTNRSITDFSYSTWVNLNTVNRSVPSEWMYIMGGYYTATASLRIGVNPSDPSYKQIWFGYNSAADVGYWFGSQQVSQLQTNQWIHIVATMATTTRGNVASVYLNGSLLTSRTNTPRIPIDFNNYVIGNDGGGNRYPMDGQLDEVRIYNRALTAAEIANLYNLDRQKTLVYGVNGKGSTAATSGNQIVTSSGFFVADNMTQRTAFVWLSPNKTFTLENHNDIDVQSTGILNGATTLYSLAATNGSFPKVEKDTIWLSGLNTSVALAKNITVCVPSKITGSLNTLTLEGGPIIESQAATLMLDKVSTLTALTNGERLDSTITRLTNGLKAQGYTPAP